MRIILTRGARLELRDATKWYAERSEIAARRFDAAFDAAASRAAERPGYWHGR
jgi:plasmid stabilization system protein ParE